MIRPVAFSTCLLIILALVKTTWLGALTLWGVAPDPGLLVLLWISYRNGPVIGSSAGFLSGLVEDFLSAAPFGFHAFTRTALAVLASLLHNSVAIDRLLLPLLIGALGTIGNGIFTGILGLVFAGKINAYSFLEAPIWIQTAYNSLLCPFVFLILSLFKKFLVERQERE